MAATADKRRQLLDAAVRVFAQKGYHTSRVQDIATEAGVAHGLLYHYFSSKEEVLETVFRETWALMLDAVRGVEEMGEPAREQLRKVAAIVLRTWRDNPDLIRVLVKEVTRSSHLQERVEEVEHALEALERIVRKGQDDGDFKTDVDARFAAVIYYGALEEILTSWLMGQLPDDEESVRQAEYTVVETVCGGLQLNSK